MGDSLYAYSLLGKTVAEASALIKDKHVYLNKKESCRINTIEVVDSDTLSTSDYVEDRLSVEVVLDYITEIVGTG